MWSYLRIFVWRMYDVCMMYVCLSILFEFTNECWKLTNIIASEASPTNYMFEPHYAPLRWIRLIICTNHTTTTMNQTDNQCASYSHNNESYLSCFINVLIMFWSSWIKSHHPLQWSTSPNRSKLRKIKIGKKFKISPMWYLRTFTM